MADNLPHPSSFRDPSGFVFFHHHKYYRHIRSFYASDYQCLMKGPYQHLVDQGMLIPHQEIGENLTGDSDFFLTLLPEQIDFISYPYEWCFDQLKDTALLCLEIMKTSINHGLILKDASPFNFQLLRGKPVLIDTLSFEQYNPGLPWIAYRQFCEGFLFPLLINHYLGLDFQQLLAVYPDGIPASLTAKILPLKSRLSLGTWLHVFLQHSVSIHSKPDRNKFVSFTRDKMIRLLDHLYSMIGSLKYHGSAGKDWSRYYDGEHPEEYSVAKNRIFSDWVGEMQFSSALDLGTNLGIFAEILARNGAMVIATDMDSRCINQLYLKSRANAGKNIHPILADLAFAYSSGGFRQSERQSFSDRARMDLVSALAIIHHLVLIRNIPLVNLASYCSDLSKKYLIAEFIPLSDAKVQLMMTNKKTFHQPYDRNAFEMSFDPYFIIEQIQPIQGTERVMYKMKKRVFD